MVLQSGSISFGFAGFLAKNLDGPLQLLLPGARDSLAGAIDEILDMQRLTQCHNVAACLPIGPIAKIPLKHLSDRRHAASRRHWPHSRNESIESNQGELSLFLRVNATYS